MKLGKKGFHVEKVYDKRTWKTNLGIALDYYEGPTPIEFADTLEKYLQTYFDKNLPPEPNDIPIALVVHELLTNERITATGAKAFVDLKFTFCKKDSSGEWAKIYTSDLHYADEFSIGFSTDRRFGTRIAKAIDSSFHNFSRLNWQNKVLSKIPSYESVKKQEGAFQKGFRSNFIEFVNNVSSGTYPHTSLNYNKDSTKIKVPDPEGVETCDQYGFSDGEHLYISASTYANGCHFAQILDPGYYYYFEDHINGPAATTVAIASGLFGGLIGGAIGGAAASEIKDKKAAFVLNPRTGVITLLEDKKKILKVLYADKDLYNKFRAVETPDFETTKNYVKLLNKKKAKQHQGKP